MDLKDFLLLMGFGFIAFSCLFILILYFLSQV